MSDSPVEGSPPVKDFIPEILPCTGEEGLDDWATAARANR